MDEQESTKGRNDAGPHIALDFTYLLQSFRYSLMKFLADAATSKGYPCDSDPYGRPWYILEDSTRRLIVPPQGDRDGWQEETWAAVQVDDVEKGSVELAWQAENAPHQGLAYLPTPHGLTSGRWDDVERFENLDKSGTLQRWVPLFIADVQKVLNRQKDNDRLDEHFRSLVKAVEGWRVPRLCDVSFAPNDAPKDAKEVRDAILEKLEAIEQEQTSAGMQNMERLVSTTEPIKWKGSVQVLAWLIQELHNKGWIEVPTHSTDIPTRSVKKGAINASKCAKNIAPHFKDVKQVSLEQELKPQGSTVSIDDIREFKIPERTA